MTMRTTSCQKLCISDEPALNLTSLDTVWEECPTSKRYTHQNTCSRLKNNVIQLYSFCIHEFPTCAEEAGLEGLNGVFSSLVPIVL